ncbi:MAG: hypothetical protein AAGA55_12980 [Planctomycetota bacterium]
MERNCHYPTPGFTILEILAVITVAGLIAATVVPAVARMTEARAFAGVHEAARMLGYARALGASSGHPAGIRFNSEHSTTTLVTYNGSAITVTDSMQGMPDPITLESTYGAAITAVRLSPQDTIGVAADTTTLWFDHRGTPHLRAEIDDSRIEIGGEPTITFRSGASIIVNATSGLIEVEP